jgi:hypothetical protein
MLAVSLQCDDAGRSRSVARSSETHTPRPYAKRRRTRNGERRRSLLQLPLLGSNQDSPDPEPGELGGTPYSLPANSYTTPSCVCRFAGVPARRAGLCRGNVHRNVHSHRKQPSRQFCASNVSRWARPAHRSISGRPVRGPVGVRNLPQQCQENDLTRRATAGYHVAATCQGLDLIANRFTHRSGLNITGRENTRISEQA